MMLSLLALNTFRFPGGSGERLVSAIETALHKPVVFVVAEKENFRRFSFGFANEAGFRKSLRLHSGLQSDPNSYALSFKGWPDEYIRLAGTFLSTSPPRSEATNGWPEKPEIDGTISLSSQKCLLPLSDIPTKLFGKPVVAHRIFRYMKVAAKGKFLNGNETLRSLAAALGARLTESKEGWSLVPDVKEYRRRMRSTLEARAEKSAAANEDPVNVADARLCAEAIAAASDDQLRSVLDGKNEFVVTATPGTSLGNATEARIGAYLRRRDVANFGGAGALAAQIDMDRPISVVVDPYTGLAHVRGKLRGMSNTGIDF